MSLSSPSTTCALRGTRNQGFRSVQGRVQPACNPARSSSTQQGVVLATMVGPDKALNYKRLPSKSDKPIEISQWQSRLRGKSFDPLSEGGKVIEERAMRLQMETHLKYPNGRPELSANLDKGQLEEAYARCGAVTAEYAKTFYLGTTLMTPEKAKAIWAIYVWCRRTDELVDGPNSSRITPEVRTRLYT